MPAVVNVMKEEASLVTLVKPQFEARRSQVRNFCYYFSVLLHIFNLSSTTTHVFTIFLSCICAPLSISVEQCSII